jgi:hypothetical protein
MRQKPHLLSDNGSCYITGKSGGWLQDKKMNHVRGATFRPQTRGKNVSGCCKQRLPASGADAIGQWRTGYCRKTRP